ncbi:hypothetical protein [Agromyces aerolatus]|uniref:hypothetical protein n=1 Tax=Agromyces sp. LY-1074 TaxID=3074080 RepID=UPI002857396A|nr:MULTISPECIES: hypothetical protein [unclassified Agromyces]MDR5699893.1 hypothetical protein [Agromyces sp. LY-1074]MDR5706295.1 hypothetical protein [Agromyces sp. LY-1358]
MSEIMFRSRVAAGAASGSERFPADVPGLRFASARSNLWRVATADGTVLGHIERVAAADGERYLARRARPGLAHAIELGRFATSRDAAEVFR